MSESKQRDIEIDFKDILSNLTEVKGQGFAMIVTSLFSLGNLTRFSVKEGPTSHLLVQLLGGIKESGWATTEQLDEIVRNVGMLEAKQLEYMRKG